VTYLGNPRSGMKWSHLHVKYYCCLLLLFSWSVVF